LFETNANQTLKQFEKLIIAWRGLVLGDFDEFDAHFRGFMTTKNILHELSFNTVVNLRKGAE
jgi:hypothetical protein